MDGLIWVSDLTEDGRPMRDKNGRRRTRDPPGRGEGIYSRRRKVFHPTERHGEDLIFLGRRGEGRRRMESHWVNLMSLPSPGPNPNPRLRLPLGCCPPIRSSGRLDPAQRGKEAEETGPVLCHPPLGLRSAFPWLNYALSLLFHEGEAKMPQEDR